MAGGSQRWGVRLHTRDVLDDMSAILQVIPSFVYIFSERRVSVAPETDACHNYPVNRKQA